MSKTAPKKATASNAVKAPALPATIALSASQQASLEMFQQEEKRIIATAQAALVNLNLRRQLVMREIEVGVKIPEGSLEKYIPAGNELVLAEVQDAK